MTGEALYNAWRECAWEAHVLNHDLEMWKDLPFDQQEAWNSLAEKVVFWEE